jgi:hypothetical protein
MNERWEASSGEGDNDEIELLSDDCRDNLETWMGG